MLNVNEFIKVEDGSRFFSLSKLAQVLCDLEKKISGLEMYKMNNNHYAQMKWPICEEIASKYDKERAKADIQMVKENDTKWREGALWAIDEAEKCIKPLLQYCKDVNGRDDCKNCGLDEDIFADLRKKIDK